MCYVFSWKNFWGTIWFLKLQLEWSRAATFEIWPPQRWPLFLELPLACLEKTKVFHLQVVSSIEENCVIVVFLKIVFQIRDSYGKLIIRRELMKFLRGPLVSRAPFYLVLLQTFNPLSYKWFVTLLWWVTSICVAFLMMIYSNVISFLKWFFFIFWIQKRLLDVRPEQGMRNFNRNLGKNFNRNFVKFRL